MLRLAFTLPSPASTTHSISAGKRNWLENNRTRDQPQIKCSAKSANCSRRKLCGGLVLTVLCLLPFFGQEHKTDSRQISRRALRVHSSHGDRLSKLACRRYLIESAPECTVLTKTDFATEKEQYLLDAILLNESFVMRERITNVMEQERLARKEQRSPKRFARKKGSELLARVREKLNGLPLLRLRLHLASQFAARHLSTVI